MRGNKTFSKMTRRWAPAYAPCPESGLGAHAVIEEPTLLWQNDNDHACLDALSKMRHQNRKVEVDQKII